VLLAAHKQHSCAQQPCHLPATAAAHCCIPWHTQPTVYHTTSADSCCCLLASPLPPAASLPTQQIRAKELRIQRNNAWIKTINIMMVFGTPPAAATAIFACYEVFVGRLIPTLSFTALSLFNVMRFPLVVLPKALRGLSEALASLQRIEAFLNLPTEHRDRQVGGSRVGVAMVSPAAGGW
jgi:hypothetical protein